MARSWEVTAELAAGCAEDEAAAERSVQGTKGPAPPCMQRDGCASTVVSGEVVNSVDSVLVVSGVVREFIAATLVAADSD